MTIPPNPFQEQAERVLDNYLELPHSYALVEAIAEALLASHQEGIKEGAERVRDAVAAQYLKVYKLRMSEAEFNAVSSIVEAAKKAVGV